MRILLITENDIVNTTGGIQTHCRYLKKNLEKAGDYVDVLDASNFSAITYLFNKPIVNSKEIFYFFRESNFDIYHFHKMSSFFVIECLRIANKLGKNIIITPHYHPFKAHKRPLLAKLFFHFKVKPILQKNNIHIISLSKREFQFFSSYSSNVTLIPGGHDIQNSMAHSKGEYLLFIGRLDSNKNFDFLQENVQSLPIKAVTNKDIKNTENISFYHKLNDAQLGKLYREALCTVIPSRYEALSLVALESLAYGTPVVVSDQVQIKDYFPSDICRVYRFNDSKEFIKILEDFKLINGQDYFKLSAKCIKETQLFSWSKMSNKIRQKYKEIKK